MAVNARHIVIVGCGPGSPDYLTEAARQAVAEAEVILGSRRLLELFADGAGQRVAVGADVAAVLAAIAAHRAAGRRVAVLVSGDPGLFSLARPVIGALRPGAVPGRAGRQLPCRWPLPGWDSTGPTPGSSAPTAARRRSTAEELRPRPTRSPSWAARREAMHWTAGPPASWRPPTTAYLCENLTLDGERVRADDAAAVGRGRRRLARSGWSILLRRSILRMTTRNIIRHRRRAGRSGVDHGQGGPDPGRVPARVRAAVGGGRRERGPGDRPPLPAARRGGPRAGLPHDRRRSRAAARAGRRRPGRCTRRLSAGEDCCFLTLGDPLLYSTYVYLLRELRAIWSRRSRIVTVPGITAFSAAAADRISPSARASSW